MPKVRRKSNNINGLRQQTREKIVRFDLTQLTHFVSHKGLRLGRGRQGVKTPAYSPFLVKSKKKKAASTD